MRRAPKPPTAHSSRFPPGFELRGRARDVLRGLLDDPLVSAADLGEEVEAHLTAVNARALREEFVDIALLRRLGDACRGLIAAVGDDGPTESRRLVQAVVHYFILETDAESDFSSVVGFDDDAEVFNAVARFLQRTDLLIEVS